MITDLNETLKQLLVQRVPLDPAEVDIAFDLPNREWAAGLAKPTVDLYLYDIRENREFRETDWEVERNGNRGARRRRPLRIDLSYMITAWTQVVEDQHRLLWHTLATFLRHTVLPPELLQGELRATVERLRLEVRLEAAQADGPMKSPADFWSALDNQLRPGINCVATVPLDLEAALAVPLVLTKVLKAGQRTEKDRAERVQVAGRVRAKGKDGQPLAGARVSVRGRGLEALADDQGRFTLRGLGRGRHTLQVAPPGGPVKEIAIEVPSAGYDLEV